ncbi:MAG: hypothetical protein ACRDE5_03260 [Ginsengibacter sp.]
MKCQICGKEFNEYTGRRAKKFCSDVCKVKYWNKVRLSKKKANTDKSSVVEEKKEEASKVPIVKKRFEQLLQEAKDGILNMYEFEMADLTPNQRTLILSKIKT